MIITRQTIDDALLVKAPATGTANGQWPWAVPPSKHWQSWSNTSSQPALYQKRVKEAVSATNRGLNKYILMYEWWIYQQYENANTATDPYDLVINPLLDLIDTALAPPVESDWQNLGVQQVGNVRIEGDIDIADGTIDGQILLVIPISVYVGGVDPGVLR